MLSICEILSVSAVTRTFQSAVPPNFIRPAVDNGVAFGMAEPRRLESLRYVAEVAHV
jgi:hypothetical protein